MRKIYWAAPFFNQPERDVCSRVEAMADAAPRVKLFSPRRDGGNANRQGDVKSNAKAIYDENLRALLYTQEIIAWLDRPQLAGQAIMLCEQVNPLGVQAGNPPLWEAKRGPLEQPDIGTVWELGFAASHNYCTDFDEIQIVGFTERTPEQWAARKGNVMIGQCLHGMICGWEQLAAYLNACDADAALNVLNLAGNDPMGGDVE